MKEKTLSENLAFSGTLLKVHVAEVETARGVKCKREFIKHNGGASILAYKDGKIILEKQFRYPYGEEIYEIPAGKRDEGEKFFETAKRELEEETGYIPLNLQKICEFYPTPAYTNEITAVFYADEFEKGNVNFDDNEDLSFEWVAVDKAFKMMDDGIIKDGKTVIALLWLKNKLA